MIWMVKFLSVLQQMKNHKWGFFKISKVSELWMSNLWAWNVPLGHDRWNVEWINGFELLFCRLLAISFCNVSPLECQLCFKLCSDLPRIQKPGYLNMNLIWIFLNSSKFKWTELWTNMKTELKHFSSDYPHSFDNSISYWMPKMCWRWKKNILNEGDTSMTTPCVLSNVTRVSEISTMSQTVL